MTRFAVFLLAACCATATAADRPLTVFAAASLREAFDKVDREWVAAGHPAFLASYAASSTLARQIEQGAPADVFVSADDRWMDYLQQRRLVDPASRFVLAGNALVVVAPASSALRTLDPARPQDVLAALGGGRLAVAETASVPAGIYAKQALQKLGVWDAVSARLAQGENVRATLEYVARGDTPLGIVYFTDAKAEPRVRIVATFAASTHEPIVYPAARTTSRAQAKEAEALMAFLRGRQAAAVLHAAGFTDGR